MSRQDNKEMLKSYCAVLAEQVEIAFDTKHSYGAGVAFNRVNNVLTRLGDRVSNGLFNVLTPKWSLIASMVQAMIDFEVMSKGLRTALEAADLDQATKSSLVLLFRSADLGEITGKGGHMIETKRLLEAIPAFSELPPDQQSKVLRAIRETHQRILVKEVLAEESKFVTSLLKALKSCDVTAVNTVLDDEISRLHERLTELRGA